MAAHRRPRSTSMRPALVERVSRNKFSTSRRLLKPAAVSPFVTSVAARVRLRRWVAGAPAARWTLQVSALRYPSGWPPPCQPLGPCSVGPPRRRLRPILVRTVNITLSGVLGCAKSGRSAAGQLEACGAFDLRARELLGYSFAEPSAPRRLPAAMPSGRTLPTVGRRPAPFVQGLDNFGHGCSKRWNGRDSPRPRSNVTNGRAKPPWSSVAPPGGREFLLRRVKPTLAARAGSCPAMRQGSCATSGLAEPAGDVRKRFRARRALKDGRGRPKFDQPT